MNITGNLYMYPEQGMMDANTYVIAGAPGIIIDPGNAMFLPGLVNAMKKDGIEPESIGTIVNTHLHGDHCGANEDFKKFSGAKIALHPKQKEHFRAVVVDAARALGMPPNEFKEDEVLSGDTLTVGDVEIRMIPAPGHSPDSVCYYLPAEKALVCGDVIFQMTTGRTDLHGGNGDDLRQSVESLAQLDIEYLLPGHMGIVTTAQNVAANFAYIRSNVFPWL